MPFPGAVGGCISGVVYGFLYIVVAGWVGGIRMRVPAITNVNHVERELRPDPRPSPFIPQNHGKTFTELSGKITLRRLILKRYFVFFAQLRDVSNV